MEGGRRSAINKFFFVRLQSKYYMQICFRNCLSSKCHNVLFVLIRFFTLLINYPISTCDNCHMIKTIFVKVVEGDAGLKQERGLAPAEAEDFSDLDQLAEEQLHADCEDLPHELVDR